MPHRGVSPDRCRPSNSRSSTSARGRRSCRTQRGRFHSAMLAMLSRRMRERPCFDLRRARLPLRSEATELEMVLSVISCRCVRPSLPTFRKEFLGVLLSSGIVRTPQCCCFCASPTASDIPHPFPLTKLMKMMMTTMTRRRRMKKKQKEEHFTTTSRSATTTMTTSTTTHAVLATCVNDSSGSPGDGIGDATAADNSIAVRPRMCPRHGLYGTLRSAHHQSMP